MWLGGPMIRQPLVPAVCITLAIVWPPNAAAQRACTSLVEEKPRQGLPFSDNTIVADKVQIDYQQKPYFIKLFSETAQKANARFEQCFRYEVESEDEVRNFFWPLAGIRIKALHPGLQERRSKNRVFQIDQDPRIVWTRVYAFENESADTKAWAPIEQETKSKDSKVKLFATTPDAVLPGLGGFLQQLKFPSRVVVGYVIDQSTSQSYSHLDSYTGPSFKIDVRSDATRKGERIVLRTEIVASGPAAQKGRYAMPALRALQQIDAPAVKLETYQRFVAAFSKVSREPERYQGKWLFTREIAVSDLLQAGLFVMNHPVVIDRDGELDCFLTSTYSPFAVSFPLQECPLFSR